MNEGGMISGWVKRGRCMPNGPISRHATAPLTGREWRGILTGPPAWVPMHIVHQPVDSGAGWQGMASDNCGKIVSVTRVATLPAS